MSFRLFVVSLAAGAALACALVGPVEEDGAGDRQQIVFDELVTTRPMSMRWSW